MDIALGVIASVPPGINPYDHVRKYIETSLVPATGRALAVNLVICSVLQFIALGLAIAVLWGKIRGKEVWIVKKKDTARGTLWLPNSGLLWTVFSIYYYAVAQLDLWSQYRSAEHDKVAMLISSYTTCLKWLGLFAALWSESHSYAASAFLSTFQRDTKTSNGMLAMAFNGFFIFGYIFNFVAPLTVGIIAPLEYEKAWYGVMELLDSITEAGANWDGTAALTIKPIWLTQFDSFYYHLMHHLELMEIAYQILLTNFLFISLFYFISAYYYTKCLRKQINRDFDQLNQAYSKDESSRSDHVSELRWTYKLLVAKAVCVGCIAVALLGLVIAPVTDFEAFYTDISLYSIEMAGQYWPMAFCGNIILGLMAYRTWRDKLRITPRQTNSQDSLRLALGLPYSFVDKINVASETVVTVDSSASDVAMKPGSYKFEHAFSQAHNKSLESLEECKV